jgi:hypothetical protein
MKKCALKRFPPLLSQSLLYPVVIVHIPDSAVVMPDLVPHRFRLLARSVGLAITTVTRGDEKKRILVYSSRWSALSKAAVHILPASVSLFLLTMNFQGRFIGRELQGIRDNDDIKLSLLQVAAKLQVSISNLQHPFASLVH